MSCGQEKIIRENGDQITSRELAIAFSTIAPCLPIRDIRPPADRQPPATNSHTLPNMSTNLLHAGTRPTLVVVLVVVLVLVRAEIAAKSLRGFGLAAPSAYTYTPPLPARASRGG